MSTSGPIDVNEPFAPADALLPVGAWIRLRLPDLPEVVAFTYSDPEAGFSAQGWRVEAGALDQSQRIFVRLCGPVPWQRLGPDEVRTFGLEASPSWPAQFYGPQPPAGSLWGAWREHPKLKARFLPEYADDLQVLVHDGGPRIARHPPEVVWVRVSAMEGEVFRGRVLNQPCNLQSVRQGSEIKFLAADAAPFPVMVTDKYLAERENWVVQPCLKCGFQELFDAPSDLIRVVFSGMPADARMCSFSTFCPLCGGVQTVESPNDLTGS